MGTDKPPCRRAPKGPVWLAGRRPGLPWWSEKIDALFAPWSAKQGMPGAAVRVVRHGTVIHSGHYGLADLAGGVPIGPSTSFLLASLTKQFTAMAILMLVEEGRLSYDSRVSEFFPDFPGYARDITMRHLLQHTSGLREYGCLFIKEGKVSRPEAVNDPWPRSANSPPSAYEPTSEDTLQLLSRADLQFAPGADRVYSNSGYVVLGQIARAVSGRSYPAFLKRRIFDPIGMRHSVVPIREWRKVPNRAWSYSWVQHKYQDIDYTPLNLVYGEDGIYTTIDDMVRWDQALYTSELVKQSTLDEAFRPGKLNNGDPIDSGYGWFIGRDFVDHDGAWLGFRTYIRRYRSRRLTIIVLANCAELNAASMGNDIAEIVLDV
jgi:CubicO group peptidase (beta-lactamase class C family)